MSGTDMEKINLITSDIINAAIAVHRELGPGLLESVYNKCMVIQLESLGLKCEYEVPVPIMFKGRRIQEEGFRADLVVEDLVVVELKSVEEIKPVHKKQLLTYLRLMDKRVGLLINFNVVLLKDGIERIVNGFAEE